MEQAELERVRGQRRTELRFQNFGLGAGEHYDVAHAVMRLRSEYTPIGGAVELQAILLGVVVGLGATEAEAAHLLNISAEQLPLYRQYTPKISAAAVAAIEARVLEELPDTLAVVLRTASQYETRRPATATPARG